MIFIEQNYVDLRFNRNRVHLQLKPITWHTLGRLDSNQKFIRFGFRFTGNKVSSKQIVHLIVKRSILCQLLTLIVLVAKDILKTTNS